MINAKRIAAGLSTLSILASVVVVAASAPANPAVAGSQGSFTIYEFTYFSDATQSSVVGYARQGCYPADPGIQQWGSVTQYVSANPIGSCNPDGTGIYY